MGSGNPMGFESVNKKYQLNITTKVLALRNTKKKHEVSDYMEGQVRPLMPVANFWINAESVQVEPAPSFQVLELSGLLGGSSQDWY